MVDVRDDFFKADLCNLIAKGIVGIVRAIDCIRP